MEVEVELTLYLQQIHLEEERVDHMPVLDLVDRHLLQEKE